MLVTASSFSPLAMTACVPALPAIGMEFDLPLSTVQFAISIYLLGLALAQPVYGVLADRYGRRPVFLGGFAVFTLAGLACAYICGALVGSRVIRRHGSEDSLRLGLCGTFSGAGLILLTLWAFPVNVLTIIAPFLFLFAFPGLVNPPSMAGAVAHHPDKAGTASGISNSMSMAIGALAAVIASLVYNGNILSLYLPVVASVVLSALAYLLLVATREE